MGRDKAQIIVPDHISGVGGTSFPDAPNDTIQYGRQNGTWTPTRQPPDNPQDGKSYCRVNTSWAEVPPGTFVDAPADGNVYGRQDGAWEVVPPSIEEAPIDTTPYARQDAGWVPTVAGVEEAPLDGVIYGRTNATWVPTIEEAPIDATPYVRQDAGWVASTSFVDAPADGIQYGRIDNAWTPTIPEAPIDGVAYSRQDAGWVASEVFIDAPVDTTPYSRQDADWVPAIQEAPIDGKAYARQDALWAEVPATTWVDAPPDGILYGRQNNSWQPTIDDAPADTITYGRRDNLWTPTIEEAPIDTTPYVRQDAGWVNIMTGKLYYDPLVLVDEPLQVVHKQYVDENVLWRGFYIVATNTPDLATVVKFNSYSWTAITQDPAIAEPLIIDLPGLPIGTMVSQDDLLIWDEVQAIWIQLADSSSSKYVEIAGDTMDGNLEIDCTAAGAAELSIRVDPVKYHFGYNSTPDGFGLFREETVGHTVVNQPIMIDGPTGKITLLDVDGGVFTTKAGNPNEDNELTRKAYVDAAINTALLDYLPISGGSMRGQLFLTDDPVIDDEAVTKHYVDVLVASQVKYLGTWQVAANIPDITAGASAGEYYIAVTVDDTIPEIVPPGILGIEGLSVNYGDEIIWNSVTGVWEILTGGGGMTVQEADTRYVHLTGDTMTGRLIAQQGVDLGGNTVSSPTDLTKHLVIHGGTYGLSVTSATLNYVVASSGWHVFRSNNPIRISNWDGSNERDLVESLASGWTSCSLASGNYGTVQVRKELGNRVVRLWCEMNRGGSQFPQHIDLFTIPDGFRPKYYHAAMIAGNGINQSFNALLIGTNGLTNFLWENANSPPTHIYCETTWRLT